GTERDGRTATVRGTAAAGIAAAQVTRDDDATVRAVSTLPSDRPRRGPRPGRSTHSPSWERPRAGYARILDDARPAVNLAQRTRPGAVRIAPGAAPTAARQRVARRGSGLSHTEASAFRAAARALG